MDDFRFNVFFFSTVFQSYQGDGRMMMKAVCDGTPLLWPVKPAATSSSNCTSKET